MLKHGKARRGTTDPTYRSWAAMRQRCNNKNCTEYKNYGGRGIKICKRWNDFSLFLLDLGERQVGFQLGRINNKLGYSPTNCRWETPKQNSRNTRKNKRYTYLGESKSIAEWAEGFGINRKTATIRLSRGWTFDETFVMQKRVCHAERKSL